MLIWLAHQSRGPHLGESRRRGLGAVHDDYVVAQQLGRNVVNRLGKQRVVRASEDQRIDTCRAQLLEIGPGDGQRYTAVDPAFFRQRNK